jgi:hypothetical protein
MTHPDLVELARKWLIRKRCAVVVTEMASSESETPDAIGWLAGRSILVECKTSRADFLADGRKYFREQPERGMGHKRYFMAVAGMIRVSDLPPGWGLLEVGVKIREAHAAEGVTYNAAAEVHLLLSVVRRGVKIEMIACRYYTMDERKNRATITADENGALSENGGVTDFGEMLEDGVSAAASITESGQDQLT